MPVLSKAEGTSGNRAPHLHRPPTAALPKMAVPW